MASSCLRLAILAFCFSTALAVGGRIRGRNGVKSGAKSGALGTASADFFNPIFYAPQLTPKEFLMISSPTEKKIVFTEIKNFKSTTGRTFALVDSGLVDPRGMSFDRDRGALYVADKGAKRIFRYHVYVDDSSGTRTLTTDGVQLCIAQNADTEWVDVDVNGDVFYSDATSKTINRIPINVIEMLSKGQYAAGDVVLVSEKSVVSGSGSGSSFDDDRKVYAVYQGSVNPHVSVPAGVVSDGARLYWTNAESGKTAGSVVEGSVAPKLAQGETAYPSKALTNATDIGFGITKSNKMVFYTLDVNGLGQVSGVTNGGVSFALASGLSAPRGLSWDGDQTIFVADQAAGTVYSIPAGRIMENAPLTKSAVLDGAFGVALFSEHDQAWNMRPFA